MFHHQIKHLEVRQKYSAARLFFNSLLVVSSGDKILRLMLDILLETISYHIDGRLYIIVASVFIHFLRHESHGDGRFDNFTSS